MSTNENENQDNDRATTHQPTAEPTPAPRKQPPKPTDARMKLADFQRNRFVVTPEKGVEVNDLLQPAYWAHIATKFRPYDEVTVIPEDGSFYAKLLVIACDRLWAKMHLLEDHDLTPTRKDMPQVEFDGYAVEWKGPLSRFAAIRKSDGVVLKDLFQNQLEGWQWLDGYMKTLAA